MWPRWNNIQNKSPKRSVRINYDKENNYMCTYILAVSRNNNFGGPLYIGTLVHYRLGYGSVCRFDIFRQYNIIIWSLKSPKQSTFIYCTWVCDLCRTYGWTVWTQNAVYIKVTACSVRRPRPRYPIITTPPPPSVTMKFVRCTAYHMYIYHYRRVRTWVRVNNCKQ